MKPKKRVRKPRPIERSDSTHLYAGIDVHTTHETPVYIGARYYDDNAQIHLNFEETRKLHAYLSKVIKWMESE